MNGTTLHPRKDVIIELRLDVSRIPDSLTNYFIYVTYCTFENKFCCPLNNIQHINNTQTSFVKMFKRSHNIYFVTSTHALTVVCRITVIPNQN